MIDERSNEPRSADQWYSAMKTWTRDRNRLIARAERAESQNQALQREVENKAAILNAIEALLDVDDEHTGWDRIVALQERAEKAEALLRDAVDLVDTQTVSEQGWHDDVIDYFRALSPTQETDRVQHNHRERVEGCFRCDLSAQETDPG